MQSGQLPAMKNCLLDLRPLQQRLSSRSATPLARSLIVGKGAARNKELADQREHVCGLFCVRCLGREYTRQWEDLNYSSSICAPGIVPRPSNPVLSCEEQQ